MQFALQENYIQFLDSLALATLGSDKEKVLPKIKPEKSVS